MIVLVIVAILTAIAIPGYRGYLLRTHRTEAKSALLGLATAQEKHHLQHGRYASAAELTAEVPLGLGIGELTPGGRYRVAIDSADAGAFSASATAAGAQADDAPCRVFRVNATGVRSAASADGNEAPGCWN